MNPVLIKCLAIDDPCYAQVLTLRDEILRRPLGLSLDDEDLSAERDELVIAALSKELVVGCIMLRPVTGGVLKARQMAVAESYQGKGIGKMLIDEAERMAGEKGFITIVLHARKSAFHFYKALGYEEQGEEFSEVGIPHIFMQKILA